MNAHEPLILTDTVAGPWLALRAGTPAEAAHIVLVGDPRAPTMWRTINAAIRPVVMGHIERARLTPLADFAICATLYSRSHTLSVWRIGMSRACRTNGQGWPWEGWNVESIRVHRDRDFLAMLDAAVRDCNACARVRA